MPSSPYRPFEHPAAWKAGGFGAKDDFAIELGRRHIEALVDELARCKASGHDLGQLNRESFPLTAIRDDVEAWRREVQHGRGLVLLRGLPVDRLPLDDLRMLYLGLGCHFGRPVSQSALGDLVGDVVDVGGKDRRERAYRSSRALKLHTDRCDHIAMLCVRPAASGGWSGYASALTIHNEMLRERPDLLALLYRGYHHHRFGEQPSGEPLVTRERIPIFSVAGGVPSVICIRGYIDLAAEEGHVTLDDAEREALDYMEAVADRPEVRLDFLMEPGEVTFTNNCLLLHTRTEFEDSADPAQKRLLLRLWLREDGRPMSPGAALHKGRAGIEKREGKGTYYAPPGTPATSP
jgi:Taurine catabolism dioxygenase TauD, TfdA family